MSQLFLTTPDPPDRNSYFYLMQHYTHIPPLIICSSSVCPQVCLFHAFESLMAFWWPKNTIAPLKNELSDPLDGSGGGNFSTSNKITYNKIRWPFFTWSTLLWKVKSWHFKEQHCSNFKCSFVSKTSEWQSTDEWNISTFPDIFPEQVTRSMNLLICEPFFLLFTIFVQAFWIQ